MFRSVCSKSRGQSGAHRSNVEQNLELYALTKKGDFYNDVVANLTVFSTMHSLKSKLFLPKYAVVLKSFFTSTVGHLPQEKVCA